MHQRCQIESNLEPLSNVSAATILGFFPQNLPDLSGTEDARIRRPLLVSIITLRNRRTFQLADYRKTLLDEISLLGNKLQQSKNSPVES